MRNDEEHNPISRLWAKETYASNKHRVGSLAGAYADRPTDSIDPSADHLEVLYTFKGGTDGAYPYAGLIRDKAGNLYGTTHAGPPFGFGTVFTLIP